MAKQVMALTADPISTGDVLSFDSDGLTLSGVSIGWQDTSHWWQPYPTYPTAAHIYSYSTPGPNPTEKAFRIVFALMEKGMVGDLSVKEFVSLVNDVAEIVRTN